MIFNADTTKNAATCENSVIINSKYSIVDGENYVDKIYNQLWQRLFDQHTPQVSD